MGLVDLYVKSGVFLFFGCVFGETTEQNVIESQCFGMNRVASVIIYLDRVMIFAVRLVVMSMK